MGNRKAFSLVELLIVITIIGILAVAFLPSITSGPSRARDVQRISDLGEAAIALELYYQDNGSYPSAGSSPDAPLGRLADYFDGNLPSDPVPTWDSGSTAGEYFYQPCSNNLGYVLKTRMENGKDTEGYYEELSSSNHCVSSSYTSWDSGVAGDPFYIMFKNAEDAALTP